MPPIDIRMDVDPDETIAYGRDDHGSSSIGNLQDESTPDTVNETQFYHQSVLAIFMMSPHQTL